jgi:hypothetical protein
LTVEEASKVGVSKALVICDAQASQLLDNKLEVNSIRTGIELERNRIGKIMPELYNLDDCLESAKPVKMKIDLDLDLYQMEKF